MISKRLQLAAEYLKGFHCLADCGTDHGYLPIFAVENHFIEKAFASDNKQEPLNNAIKNILAANLERQITIVLADGLSYLTDEIDVVSILGMGGRLIASILSLATLKHVKRLVLSAHSEQAILRSFLQENNWRIIDEIFIEEKRKHYQLIVAEPGQMELSSMELEFGPIIMKNQNKDFIAYIQKLIHKLELAQKHAKQIGERESIQERINDLKEVLE